MALAVRPLEDCARTAAELRAGDARWAFVVVLFALLGILIVGDPGRIDRGSRWLRALTGTLIGVISAMNAA